MKEITKNRWKKFGYLCLTFVPMLVYLAISMVAAIAMSVFIAITGVIQGEEDIFNYIIEESLNQGMMTGIIYAALGIVVLGLWYYFGCKRKKLKPPKGVITPVNIVILAVLGYCMQYVSTYIISFIGMLFPDTLEAYINLMETTGIGEVTVTGILYVVILGPIAEEITFRGMTLYFAGKFTKRFWLANILQALLFGIFHLNLIQGVYAFVLGLLMGWICRRYRSLYASIWFHIFFNFLSFGTLEFLDGFLPQNTFFQIIWAVVMCGLTAGFILLIRKRTAAPWAEASEDKYPAAGDIAAAPETEAAEGENSRNE